MTTPKTDKILEDNDFDAENCHDPLVELAKQLEHELNAANQRIAVLERRPMTAEEIISQP